MLKMFYPPRGLCKAELNGVHLTVLPFYCVWEAVLTLLKSQFSIDLLKILKMFYPPKGICVADPVWGPIDFSYVLSVPSRELGHFVSQAVIRLLKILKMFYCGWDLMD